MRVRQAFLPLLALLPLSLAVLHCGDDDPSVSPTADAAATSSSGGSSSGGSSSGGGTSSGGTSSGSPGPGECGTTKVCVDVEVPDDGKPFRVAVIWYQLDDDGPDPKSEATYDKEFPAGTKTIEIALSEIPASTDEKLLFCARDGEDEEKFPCTSDFKVGFAHLIMYRDTTGDGKPQVYYEKGDELVGAGNLVFLSSDKAYDGTNWPEGQEQALGRLFPTGVQEGVQIYQLDRPEAGSFDRAVKSSAGTRNKITEKGPNLT